MIDTLTNIVSTSSTPGALIGSSNRGGYVSGTTIHYYDDTSTLPWRPFSIGSSGCLSYLHVGSMTRLYQRFAITTSYGETTMVRKQVAVFCPQCKSRAIRGSDGNDITFSFCDHDAPAKDDGHGEKNGTEARLRICSECGNVWATLKREVEK